MVKLEFDIALHYTVTDPFCDFVFNVHAAETQCQTVIQESLLLEPPVASQLHTDPNTGNRVLRLRANSGPLTLRYAATVTVDHLVAQPADLYEVPINELPTAVLKYLWPSRYCQADRLQRLAFYEFGHLPRGFARVHAIQEWVRKRVMFRVQTSDVSTSAMDTLIEQVGVCRDFAHLMIALCRALSIPARFTSGIDYGADAALGPPDFHAYVEVFLGGHWYIFDPSGLVPPMGLVRLCTGRDAADCAFAMMFGAVHSNIPQVSVRALEDAASGCVLPTKTETVLSTDP